MRTAALLVALACAGCVAEGLPSAGTFTSVEQFRPYVAYAAPPSIEQLRSEIDRQPACAQQNYDYHLSPRLYDLPTPQATTHCIVVYPRSMVRAEINANCIAMFDLDPAGVPQNIFTLCNVGHPSEELTTAWKDVAAQGFSHAAARIAQRTGYPAENDPAAAGKWRTNIPLAIEFRIAGETAAIEWPKTYSRPAPAPAFTPEQAEYHADPLAWVCKRNARACVPAPTLPRPYVRPAPPVPPTPSNQPTTSN